MNALVVLYHRPPAEVALHLADAMVGGTATGLLFSWETNISPLWARHSVADLLEEAAILGWLASIPKADFKLIRYGEELGELGELDITSQHSHPFSHTPEWIEALAEYRKECDAILARQKMEEMLRASLSSPSTVQEAPGLVLNVPHLFKDEAFKAWLNNGERKFTWHKSGEPDEWSDTVVLVDPSLNGEGSDSDMPECAWDFIVAACREKVQPGGSAHITVRLTNLEV